MINVVIKEFESNQEEIISKIHNDSFSYLIKSLGILYGYKRIEPNDVKKWLQEKTNQILVAYEKEEPVGFIHFNIEKIKGEQKEITNLCIVETTESLGQSKLAVISSKQRKSIGSQLLKATLEYARNQNVDTVMCFAYNNNEAIKYLLPRFGFQHEQFFYYKPYSITRPYAHDSVLAEFDLKNQIKSFQQNERILIRQIQNGDLKDIQQIFSECRSDIFGGNPTEKDIQNWFDSKWALETLVAEQDGEVVGCMEYTKLGIIGIPGIKLAFQKQKIGSTLFYHLLKSMKANDIKKALADTGLILNEAINMYKKFDFDLTLELWAWLKVI